MTLDRRQLLIGSAAGLAAAACGSRPTGEPHPRPDDHPPARPPTKRLLILGGTGFLGPHVIDAARARGHVVTMFNRGKTHPTLFPDVEKLQGDRDGKLDALQRRTWDAVIDTSGYVPRIVEMSTRLLAPRVEHYVFVSTISVYADLSKPIDESSPVAVLDDPASENVGKDYGALKAACEKTAEAVMPGRVTNIRPGLIVGPLDPTGRFTHWPTRLAEGGEVLAPGDGTAPIQVVDVRDLAAWMIHVVDQRTTGVFDALGPGTARPEMSMRQMLEACNAAGGNKASLTWVDAAFLEAQKVEAWSDMPAWFEPKGEMAGFGKVSNARAVEAGLTFRPIRDTAADTLAWLASPGFPAWLAEVPEDKRDRVRSSGISRAREAEVLAAWKARAATGS